MRSNGRVEYEYDHRQSGYEERESSPWDIELDNDKDTTLPAEVEIEITSDDEASRLRSAQSGWGPDTMLWYLRVGWGFATSILSEHVIQCLNHRVDGSSRHCLSAKL